MGIKNKNLVTVTVIAGFLWGGAASAVELGHFQMRGPITDTAADQGGARIRGDLRPVLLADAADSGDVDLGGVLGLPMQPTELRRPFTLEKGDLLLRMRFIDIIPKGGGGEVNISPYSPPPVKGSKLSISGATSFEGDATYMATRSIGVEVSLESSTHVLKDNNGKVASTTGKGSDLIGATSMLPLTVMAQYHFTPKPAIHPYVGLGLNYTLFYKEESGLSGADLKVDNTVGFALQTGVDIGIHEKWFLNVDLKYIDMSSTMNLSNPNSGVTDKTDLKISPWILGVGIGTYF
jgi:outer membrane protein